ncbi:hypothetical protein PVAND_000402 [Polypedilum vanderplanki]|uniref:Uncharacterized protein n=1 Tax=Polypedilum vanderplanki TaxID=319348 RepID=A0A9J6BK78_POLVA|nr:hypothetical protein PVAND_000402 [Polypedilum vanderplanki]
MDTIYIKDIRNGMKNINVIFIVLEATAATKTKENREVFSFKVADHTASINASIWDSQGKLLCPGDIIKLTKAYAAQWRGCLTLYSGKSGEIVKMGDFCMVFNEQINMSEMQPPNPQNSQQQGNHITNNGNGNNTNGNGKTNQTSSQVTNPQTTTANNSSSAKQSPNPKTTTTPPSKYMRKPINKK